MGAGDPVQPCPRCGTMLPATARFCRNCGLTLTTADVFSRPPDLASSGPTYQASVAPGYQASQAAYGPLETRWPEQEVYRDVPGVGQYRGARATYARYAGYEPDEQPRRSFWRSLWGYLTIGFLLLLVVGVSAFGIYFYPSLCSVRERNGLRDDVPLPCGITFQGHLDRSNSTTGPGSQEWVYTVDNSTPAQIKSFYQEKLPAQGWVMPTLANQTRVDPDGVGVCKDSVALLVHGTQQPTQEGDFSFSPPPRGSLLLIFVVPFKNLPDDYQQAFGGRCHP